MTIKSILMKALRLTNGYPINTFLGGKGIILCFHRIVEHTSLHNSILEITLPALQRLVNQLQANNFEIISIEEIKGRLASKNSKKFAVLTFDDGYVDNYTYALPFFIQNNLPFTIYISNSMPNNTALIWWYALEDVVRKNKHIAFMYRQNKQQYSIHSLEEEKNAFSSIRNLILSLSSAEKELFLTYFFNLFGINIQAYSKHFSLTWEQIKILSKNNLVTIGAHTKNHLALSRIDSTEVYSEIFESKIELEDMLSMPVNHFAYPFGSVNEVNMATIIQVEAIGFTTAVTTVGGNLFAEHAGLLHSLPRFLVCELTSKFFLNIMLNGTYAYINNGFKLIKSF